MARLVPVLFLALLLLAPAALAIDGKHPPAQTQVVAAADLNEKALSGDRVTAEGQIVAIRKGSGSYVIATLEDDSGRVLAAFPEYIRRQISSVPGRDPLHLTVRVAGVWDHKAMDKGTQGIRVQNLVILDD